MFFKKKRAKTEAADDALQHHFEQASKALDKVLFAANRTSEEDIETIRAGLPRLQNLWVPVLSLVGRKFASLEAQSLHSEVISYSASPTMWPKIAAHYEGVKFDWEQAEQIVRDAPEDGMFGYVVERILSASYPGFDFKKQEYVGGQSFVTALNYVEHLSKNYRLV